MSAPQRYRRDSHCVYLCDYHLVLPTKYRHPVITPELWKYLYGKLLEITTFYPKLYITLNYETPLIPIFPYTIEQAPQGA